MSITLTILHGSPSPAIADARTDTTHGHTTRSENSIQRAQDDENLKGISTNSATCKPRTFKLFSGNTRSPATQTVSTFMIQAISICTIDGSFSLSSLVACIAGISRLTFVAAFRNIAREVSPSKILVMVDIVTF